MSQTRDWRVILKELDAEKNPQNDSLELSDSWRAMPRRTEGVVNKTNGLYRRSALPPQPPKNLYNFIIEKQPIGGGRETASGPENEAPATQPPKILIANVRSITPENNSNDTLNFSEFLSVQIDGLKATTSTPYPVRQIETNKSPKRTVNAQRNAANSPNKLFVPTPTRIPISTPRTSRVQSISERRAKLPSDRKKPSSPAPLVSSTVNIVGDDEESEPVRSTEGELSERSNQILPVPVPENADRNCLPFDDDQQKQDDGTKNTDETLFRRPQMVRPPLLKQTKLDVDVDQPKVSNSSNVSQRNKKPKPKINPLLEDYMKVGESITNRTNSVPLENSSSSTRRKLYKKGDSCNEDDILKDIVPLGQPSFVLNPISAGDNGALTKAKSISVQSNAVESDLKSGNDAPVETATRDPKATAEPQSHAALAEKPALPLSGTEQNNDVDLTFDIETHDQSPLNDDGQESTSDEQNQSAASNESPLFNVSSNDDVQESANDVRSQGASSNEKQNDGTESDISETNSIDQPDHMSAKHSSKQVLEEILEDWSDTVQPLKDQEDVDRSDSTDSEEEIHPTIIKQPSTESKVRQDRSQNKKNQNTGTVSSKTTTRRGAVRSKLQQIDEDTESEEDELSTASATVRNQTKNASDAKRNKNGTRREVSAKSKGEPVHSTQQEVIENGVPDSDESEQIAEEPSNINVNRTRNIQRNVTESKVSPPNKSRLRKGTVETDDNEVELPTIMKRKANNKPSQIDSSKPGADGRETDPKLTSKDLRKKARTDVMGTDEEIEEPEKTKTRRARKKGQNVEDEETEVGGRKSELVTTSKVKKNNTEVDVTEAGEMETQPATTSKGKEKKKRTNAEDDVAESGELETQMATTSKGKERKKRANADDDVTEAGEMDIQPATTSKGKKNKKRPNVENEVAEAGKTDTKPAATSKGKEKKKRPIAEDEVTVADEAEAELVTKSKHKKRTNAEDNVTEPDENEAVLPSKSQPKTRKKRLDAEERASDERDEPQIEDDDYPAQDDTGDEIRSTAKSKVRKSQKRKHPSVADGRNVTNEQSGDGDYSSKVDGTLATKRRKLTKWERQKKCSYNSLKPRETVTGIRHSTRERRLPSSNLLFTLPNAKPASSNRSALQRQNGSVQRNVQRTNSGNTESENVFSMLLNGSMDNEPPLITHLEGIEITQGFHKTVKNNMVIHHIPGETGPSYGYFTLEPGMSKRTCRISWNLHIHVVSGPVQMVINGKSEQMVTGSFASLPSGTKYSLRNDSENSTLVFFSQHGII